MSKNSISFLTSYFLIIPAIAALPPPFRQLHFKLPNAPDNPDRPPSTTIVFVSDSLQLNEEGDIHRGERGGMMMMEMVGMVT